MEVIRYTQHLQVRLRLREIPDRLPREIYKTSREHYFDNETEKYIAIKTIYYKAKKREMALIYEKREKEIVLITLHPLKAYQKISRITLKRWQPI